MSVEKAEPRMALEKEGDLRLIERRTKQDIELLLILVQDTVKTHFKNTLESFSEEKYLRTFPAEKGRTRACWTGPAPAAPAPACGSTSETSREDACKKC